MRRLFLRLALLGAALLTTLVGLEVFIRVFDPLGLSQYRDMPRYFAELCELVGPPRILEHRPGTRVELSGFSIRTNALGLRGAELAEPKPTNEFRVLVLGDSMVLGWGAKEEQLWLSRCERAWNDEAEAGPRYRLVNSGHNQFDTVQEAALLDELGERIEPDAICLVYVGNDVVPTLTTYEALQNAPPPSGFQRATGWLRSVPFAGVNGLWVYLTQVASGAEEVEHAQRVASAADHEGWRRSRDALLRIRDWCRARRLPFVVLDHTRPARGALPAEVPPLAGFCEDEAIERLPFHFTRAELERPIRRSAADPHPNALGHAILAGKLDGLRDALR